jgi:glycolate oxidase
VVAVTTVSNDAPTSDQRPPGDRTGAGRHGPDLDALASALSRGALLTEPATLTSYRHDFTAAADAGMPLAVVRARTSADVQATVRWAGAHGVPLVPRGAGSGLSGTSGTPWTAASC